MYSMDRVGLNSHHNSTELVCVDEASEVSKKQRQQLYFSNINYAGLLSIFGLYRQ